MKKGLQILLAVLMICSLNGCKKKEVKEKVTSEAFEAQMLDWFVEDMSSDYLTMHFGISNPEKYGIKDVEVTLGEVDSEDDGSNLARIKLLESWDVSDLSEDQKVTYKTLLAAYTLNQKWWDLEKDYSFVFTPNSGVNNNLITNFTEFELRNEQDVKDIIVLVKDSKRYIDDCITYTLKQVDDGVIQSDETIESIKEQVSRFIEKVDDNEVITAFNASIDKLDIDGKQQYKKEFAQAVIDYLIPAYKSINDMYDNIIGTVESKGAVCNYPGGKEFYKVYFETKASSGKDVAQLEAEIEKAINDKFKDLVNLVYSSEDAMDVYEQSYEGDYDFGHKETYDIFKTLKEEMSKDFPEIPEVDYTISYLDPSVTSDSIVAYYLTAPVDNVNYNVVKVNPANDDANDLCITLAHEGYPGHLYQHTYYFANHDNPIRYTIDSIGYTEGWAQYVEDYAYGYFADSELLGQMLSIDNSMSYYLYGLCDVLVNYEGYTIEKLADKLEELNFNPEAAEPIYNVVVGDPCLYIPYSFGLYQMSSLNQKAIKELGSKYSSVDYNKLVLDTGVTTFDILEEEVNNYIKNK